MQRTTRKNKVVRLFRACLADRRLTVPAITSPTTTVRWLAARGGAQRDKPWREIDLNQQPVTIGPNRTLGAQTVDAESLSSSWDRLNSYQDFTDLRNQVDDHERRLGDLEVRVSSLKTFLKTGKPSLRTLTHGVPRAPQAQHPGNHPSATSYRTSPRPRRSPKPTSAR